MLARDQRADLRLRVERVADLEPARELGELADEVVVQRRLDEHARARLAALARGVVDRPDRAGQRVVELGVGEDEVRALAAELQDQALDPVGGQAHDLGAGRRRAGEGDLLHAGVLHEMSADDGPRSRDDVDRAGREADLGGELGHPQRRERSRRVGLEHHRAAGRERRRQLPGRHHQRVVPRHDLSADADRLLQRVVEKRAADRVRAPGDRRDRRSVEAEVLDRLGELGLHRGDRLADVPRLELGELLSIGGEGVGQRMQEARALGRRRLRPGAVERGPGGIDGAVDVLLVRLRDRGERCAGCGLGQVAGLAGSRLGRLAADEEAVFPGRDRHRGRKIPV